jgi:septal ring factor EnvC (AmiA/AmiB activator)
MREVYELEQEHRPIEDAKTPVGYICSIIHIGDKYITYIPFSDLSVTAVADDRCDSMLAADALANNRYKEPDEHDARDEELEDLAEENQSLELELDNLRDEIDMLRDEIDILEAETESMRDDLDAANVEIDRLEEELDRVDGGRMSRSPFDDDPCDDIPF